MRVEPLISLTNAPDMALANGARASRTVVLPGMGVEAQKRLAAARILVLGAGGLGSPVLQYLAASGVGTLGIVDFDTVDLSNLQRQVIHRTSSVGELKTASAARTIAELTDDVQVIQHPVALDRTNALALFADYDLIVDGTDNFATRYLANDAAALLGKPYVWGSVLQFDGQVTVFWEGAPDARSLDYRDLHPSPPAPEFVLSCSEAGVLATACGVIGTMMATEVVKLLTGIGEPLLGRVQNYDALNGSWSEFAVRRAPGRTPVTELIDYEAFCGLAAAPETAPESTEVSFAELAGLLAEAGVRLVDVREPWEHERDHLDGDELIPLAAVLAEPGAIQGPVIVYCASGQRSATAAAALRAAGVDARSLRGGIQAARD
jgi:molybdopterin/thiamine biosynthesis adenylyltransferase/rhodanese-related sulfurtransferase